MIRPSRRRSQRQPGGFMVSLSRARDWILRKTVFEKFAPGHIAVVPRAPNRGAQPHRAVLVWSGRRARPERVGNCGRHGRFGPPRLHSEE